MHTIHPHVPPCFKVYRSQPGTSCALLFAVCTGCDPANAGVLVAVGPEGGWVEPDELEFLQSFGFQVNLSTMDIVDRMLA